MRRANSCARLRCVAAAAAADRPDDLEMLGTGVLEQRRLRRRLDDRADVRQRDRTIVDIDLANRDQVFDKTSQPEFFEIDPRHSLTPGCHRHIGCGDPHPYQTRDPRYKQVSNAGLLP
jgi:hypothetical protein